VFSGKWAKLENHFYTSQKWHLVLETAINNNGSDKPTKVKLDLTLEMDWKLLSVSKHTDSKCPVTQCLWTRVISLEKHMHWLHSWTCFYLWMNGWLFFIRGSHKTNMRSKCTNNNCCLLPQCEALRTCCPGLPIATKWCCEQDAKVVPGATCTKRTCDRPLELPIATQEICLPFACPINENDQRWTCTWI